MKFCNRPSFKSIDPTPCHQSAHPEEHGASIAFKIQDTEGDEENVVSVSEITTRHLRRLKKSASDFLGKAVTAAVITVPTNFSDAQKSALSSAAQEAGIEVLQFIHEPVATVLAYDARPDAKVSDKNVVVADLGGTRSDIAIVASRGGMYSILATHHDYDVGGTQLDQVLMDYFAKEFIKKTGKSAEDPRNNPRSLAKLKMESEAVRKSLSIGASANFSQESLAGGLDFTATINRTRYELLANKIFASFTRLITSTVEKAGLDILDIDKIILAGGTSHTPKIAKNLQATFPESTTVLAPATSTTAINPSELSARGAAIQASLIQEFEKDDIEQSTHPMVTVTPHLSKAVGVLCISSDPKSAVFRPLIEPATPAPVRRTAHVAAPKGGGDVLVVVCEAEREIKVTKPAPKAKGEKNLPNGDAGSDEDDDDSDDDEEEEEDDVREKTWKIGRTIAQAGVKGIKKGGKVEVQLDVGADLSVRLIAREVGGKGGVRGAVGKPVENGSV